MKNQVGRSEDYLLGYRAGYQARRRADLKSLRALRYSPGMSLRFALEKFLRLKLKPQSTQQLLAMLKRIKFQFRGKRPYLALFYALHRSPQKGGSIVKVGKALWALKEWHWPQVGAQTSIGRKAHTNTPKVCTEDDRVVASTERAE